MPNIIAGGLLAALAIVALADQAAGADLDQIITAPELPAIRPVEVGSGWYLRGDVGYSVDTNAHADGIRSLAGDMFDYDRNDLTSDWSGSVGIGYHFNDWLRSDVTFEYSDGKFDGSVNSQCNGGDPAGTTCNVHQDISTWGFMANTYVDLGTVAGFTPYVGGGVGAMRLDGGDAEFTCVGSTACTQSASHPGRDDWRFAWQLSAGMAYAITQNLKLDVGYRYLQIADGGLFDFSKDESVLGAHGVQSSDDGLTKQEVRVGLRYDIW